MNFCNDWDAPPRAIRPAVMARHLCGGSRTWNGARIQQNLTSVLKTCHQQGKDSFVMLVDFLRNPQSKGLDLLPTSSAGWAESISPAYVVACPEPAVLAGRH